MVNLIRAHLARLWKAPIFWLAMAAMYVTGTGLANSAIADWQVMVYGDISYTNSNIWGQPLCGSGLLFGFVAAALFSLFFGTEYSDSAIRNKLIAGHSRGRVYFATLLTAILASLPLYLASLLNALMRLPLFLQMPRPDPAALALSLAGTALLYAGQCSVCTMLCMLIHKKAVLAVVLIFLMVFSLFVAMQVADAVGTNRGGMSMEYVGVDENGAPLFVEHFTPPTENGPVLTFMTDFWPGYQADRYMDLDGSPIMLAYSALLIFATTTVGLVGFRRKDIK